MVGGCRNGNEDAAAGVTPSGFGPIVAADCRYSLRPANFAKAHFGPTHNLFGNMA